MRIFNLSVFFQLFRVLRDCASFAYFDVLLYRVNVGVLLLDIFLFDIFCVLKVLRFSFFQFYAN